MVPCVFHIRPRVFHQTPRFPHRPRVFHRTPRFPPDPAFSTRPRVFHTPGPRTAGPRTPGPRPLVFHLALFPELLQHFIGFRNFSTNQRASIHSYVSLIALRGYRDISTVSNDFETFQAPSTRTVLEEFENRAFIMKRHRMFSVCSRMEDFNNARLTAHSGFAIEKRNLGQRNYMIIPSYCFQKVPFSKSSLSTRKRKAGVLKFLQFAESFRNVPL